MKIKTKRILGVVCALVMCVTLLPTSISALAAPSGTEESIASLETLVEETSPAENDSAAEESVVESNENQTALTSSGTAATTAAEQSAGEKAEGETTGEGEEIKTETKAEVETSVPAENGITVTDGEEPPVLLADVTGEGFVWNEETKTLTITASTGDYTTSTVSTRPYHAYRSQAEKIVVDGADIIIGSYAFYQFNAATELEIISCGDIKDHAFNFYSKLETVNIGICGNIGDRAFGQCGALGSIKIDSCGNFVTDTFKGCSGLETVKITECGDIADNVFYNQSKLSTVEIGTCGNIGKNAFNGCSALTGIYIKKCGDIGQGAFDKTGLVTVKLDECGDIASHAFVDNANMFAGGPLETLEIGSCGTIGSSAFTYLKNLKTVTIGSCESIGDSAFAFDSGLTNVTIENCVSVGEHAFMSSGAPIEELTLTDCTIESAAFYMVKVDTLKLENIESIADSAFQSSTITDLTLSGVTELGENVFGGCKGLTNLTIENVAEISEGTFKVYDETLGNNVTLITLNNVAYIGDYAFRGFNNLATVIIGEGCQYVGAHAFTGCDSLTEINIGEEVRLGYSDSLVDIPGIHERVQAILNGTYNLPDLSAPIDTIVPDGWTSVKTGANNSAETVGDTQITKEARWADEIKTIAEVQIKAYYTTMQQMDFIFVADCSNSMAGFGSDDAMNSNFYNMQSKMMDVADELLSSTELDTLVAFSTFGETEGEVSSFFSKEEAQEAQNYIWNNIVNYESNTNYSVGLKGALELVKQHQENYPDRNLTVIFISDGQPFYPGEVPEEYYGVSEANAIKAEGVQIISVLQQVPESTLPSSQENMEKIADKVFASTDLQGFSAAINDAIDYAYTSTVATPVLARGVDMSVAKIWVGDQAGSRPTSVEITLLRNGQAFGTVTLTAENGWYYFWEDLDEAYSWSVQETNVPAGYEAAATSSEGKWTITNTYTAPSNPNPNPNPDPTPSQPQTPSAGSNTSTGDNAPVVTLFAVIVVAAAAIVLLVVLKKKGVLER